MSEPTRLGHGETRRLLDAGGIRPSRALGQNFVVDPNVTERIAWLAGVGPGDTVLEIGAGLGSLTLALAGTGARVIAVEIDRRLAEQLRTILPATVPVIETDALTLDVNGLFAGLAEPTVGNSVLVANLPYNIATPLVVGLMERATVLEKLVVMVQKEVAERFVAPPGSRTYGAVSVRLAYFAHSEIVATFAPEVFHPRPKVTSSLVELRRRDEPAVDPGLATYDEITVLVRAGFAGRRKMLRRSLAGLVDEAVFDAAGIAPTARAEDLGVTEWGKLAGCRRTMLSTLSPN